ncbi:MAG: 50S ribosomal protein L5 [Nanoarchaeota archaeon]|nr:50S ribosomal protein L5 [Nanoarchaeota archaeon]
MAQKVTQDIKAINPMKQIAIDKVTVNMCVGNDKNGMIKAEKLLSLLTKKTPVKCNAKKRLNTWQIRPGLAIGYKVTLRGEDAHEFLQWVLKSKKNIVSKKALDTYGNFSVGVHEYLDLSGMKYDADIGIIGFEVMTTFKRPGFRVKVRNTLKARIPQRHKVSPEEVIEFMKEKFGVNVQ